MELITNSKNRPIAYPPKRTVVIPRQVVYLDQNSPQKVKSYQRGVEPADSSDGSDNMSIPDEYEEICFESADQFTLPDDEAAKKDTIGHFLNKGDRKQRELELGHALQKIQLHDERYLPNSCLDVPGSDHRQRKSPAYLQKIPPSNFQTSIEMKYNINTDEIIHEEEGETQQSRCGSPSLNGFPSPPKKGKVIVRKENHIRKLDQAKQDEKRKLSKPKNKNKLLSAGLKNIKEINRKSFQMPVPKEEQKSSFFTSKRHSANKDYTKTAKKVNSYASQGKRSKQASPQIRTPVLTPTPISSQFVSKRNSVQSSKNDISTQQQTPRKVNSKKKKESTKNKKIQWPIRLVQPQKKDRAQQLLKGGMNLSAALWEKSASKNQWFNIDSCTIASTKTGAMDYFKHATSSPREGGNVVRAAKYFNKQRRSFEQVSDLSLDIPLPNNKSKYQASGVKSPLNCSLKDFHQEESSKKLFFKEFQQSLTKASVKKQVRDKYFKSQLKDQLGDLSYSMDQDDSSNSFANNNRSAFFKREDPASLTMCTTDQRKPSPARSKKLDNLKSQIGFCTISNDRTGQYSFEKKRRSHNNVQSESNERFSNLFLESRKQSLENAEAANRFRQRMLHQQRVFS